jgi:hypothetical protein
MSWFEVGVLTQVLTRGLSTLTRETVIGRVPGVSADGKPLMPCRPNKARKLLEKDLAEKCWGKLGEVLSTFEV